MSLAGKTVGILGGIALCLVLFTSMPSAGAEKVYELKFATLAPAGTTWMNMLQEWADQVREESNGRLVFKIYPGGVQGDEPDVLKKIRFGQLHGGAFTGYGLGHIFSPVRVLELPFLFKDIDEIDYVRLQFMPDIEQGYRDNGFELLGWPFSITACLREIDCAARCTWLSSSRPITMGPVSGSKWSTRAVPLRSSWIWSSIPAGDMRFIRRWFLRTRGACAGRRIRRSKRIASARERVCPLRPGSWRRRRSESI